MRRALEAAGVASSGAAVEAAFAKADGDGDGKISFAEFCELHALGQAGSAGRPSAISGRSHQSDIQRIAALRLPEAKLAELRLTFARYDRDNSGSISKLEMRRALEAAGVASSGAAVEAAFAKADTDGNGMITFVELCELHALLAPATGAGYEALSEAALRRVFDAYDLERTGSLPSALLAHALRGLGVAADARQSRAALARLGLPSPEALGVSYSFAEFRDVANRLHVQAAKRGVRLGSAPRRGPPWRSGGGSPLRGAGGGSEVRSLLDQAENDKSSLRAALAREQAIRRQAQAELSAALERVSLLERLVPAALEGAAAARAGGAGEGASGTGSLEARAAALAAELRVKAGPAALSAHAARRGLVGRASGSAGVQRSAAEVYRKQAAEDKRQIDDLRAQLDSARGQMADERAARLDAERRIDAANHRAAQSQVSAPVVLTCAQLV